MNLLSNEQPRPRHGRQRGDSQPHWQGHWLVLARLGWSLIALLTGGLFLASLPAYYTTLDTLCRPGTCRLEWQLTPAQAEDLSSHGWSLSAYASYFVILSSLFVLVNGIVAVVLFWRRSEERVALLGSLALLTFGVTLPSTLDALAAASPGWKLPVAGLEFLGGVALGLFGYLFPDGRFVPRWTRWLAGVWVVVQAPSLFSPDFPFAQRGFPVLVVVGGLAGFGASLLGVLLVQVYRYRRASTPAEQQQTKWVVFGMAVTLLGVVSLLILNASLSLFEHPASLAGLADTTALYLLLLVIPCSIATAMLRSHLWDIDLLINRALVYGLLTGILGALYVGFILGLEQLVGLFGGTAGQHPVVLVISTLAIAALFHPFRQRLQQRIDRRFYRRKYDAEKTLAAFSATLRSEVDLERIQEQVLTVVSETMQPAHVSLWLRQPERHPDAFPLRLEAHGQQSTEPDPHAGGLSL